MDFKISCFRSIATNLKQLSWWKVPKSAVRGVISSGKSSWSQWWAEANTMIKIDLSSSFKQKNCNKVVLEKIFINTKMTHDGFSSIVIIIPKNGGSFLYLTKLLPYDFLNYVKLLLLSPIFQRKFSKRWCRHTIQASDKFPYSKVLPSSFHHFRKLVSLTFFTCNSVDCCIMFKQAYLEYICDTVSRAVEGERLV